MNLSARDIFTTNPVDLGMTLVTPDEYRHEVDDQVVLGQTIIEQVKNILGKGRDGKNERYTPDKICKDIEVPRALLYKWIDEKSKRTKPVTTRLSTLLKLSFERNRRLVLHVGSNDQMVAQFSGYLYNNNQLEREFMLFKKKNLIDDIGKMFDPDDDSKRPAFQEFFEFAHHIMDYRYFRREEHSQHLSYDYWLFQPTPELKEKCYGVDYNPRAIYQEFREYKYTVLNEIRDRVPYWTCKISESFIDRVNELYTGMAIQLELSPRDGGMLFTADTFKKRAKFLLSRDDSKQIPHDHIKYADKFSNLIRGTAFDLRHYCRDKSNSVITSPEFKEQYLRLLCEHDYNIDKMSVWQSIATGMVSIADAAENANHNIRATKSQVSKSNVEQHIPLYSEYEMFGGGGRGKLRQDNGLPVTNKSVLNTSDYQGDNLFAVLFTGEMYWNGYDEDGNDRVYGDYTSLYPKDTILVISATEPAKNGDEVIVQIRLWKRTLGRMEERFGRDSYISRWARETRLDDFVYCSDPDEIDRRTQKWKAYLKDEHDVNLGDDSFDAITDQTVMDEIWQKWHDLKLNEVKDWAYKVVAVIEPK